ncbi:hypothetical protein NTD84_23140 [Pseudomonas sp. 14P_8.1_Bac3]|uniref:hypothetical protein n=1 Tax=Pseudomonas sp. 14P_8.1_Bac3 TaxID=2971621 RepID=UPI0021C9F94F|nr:hypothetical protein [Pseudomonas sp. 14P_8.1_Bac3]MCU1762598.1 hypothetical protein [Pseudomonas sp. 14P_8.1_Bac3]
MAAIPANERAYRANLACCGRIGYFGHTVPVGASLLAMVVNDNVGILTLRGAWVSIASKLASTGGGAVEAIESESRHE